MASRLLFCFVSVSTSFLLSAAALADTLKITSKPAGAKVEIDGVVAGTTPFEKDYPSGYFHRRLEHAMVARISLDGYVAKEIKMTEGPNNWISLNGRNHGEYGLFRPDHFDVELKPVKLVFSGDATTRLATGEADMEPELTLAELVRKAKPAVVCLKGADKSGTGFFVADTGVIATNAHLAQGEESLEAGLSDGSLLEARVVYVDSDLDIALAKVEGFCASHASGFSHCKARRNCYRHWQSRTCDEVQRYQRDRERDRVVSRSRARDLDSNRRSH